MTTDSKKFIAANVLPRLNNIVDAIESAANAIQADIEAAGLSNGLVEGGNPVRAQQERLGSLLVNVCLLAYERWGRLAPPAIAFSVQQFESVGSTFDTSWNNAASAYGRTIVASPKEATADQRRAVSDRASAAVGQLAGTWLGLNMDRYEAILADEPMPEGPSSLDVFETPAMAGVPNTEPTASDLMELLQKMGLPPPPLSAGDDAGSVPADVD